MPVRWVIPFQRFKQEADRAVLEDVRRVTRRVLNRSVVLCPVDTGILRASSGMKVAVKALGPTGRVQYTANYAAAVHDGSAPHVIKAKTAKVLKFQVGSRTVYAKAVRHPGAPARPFLVNAARQIASQSGYIFRRRMSQ